MPFYLPNSPIFPTPKFSHVQYSLAWPDLFLLYSGGKHLNIKGKWFGHVRLRTVYDPELPSASSLLSYQFSSQCAMLFNKGIAIH